MVKYVILKTISNDMGSILFLYTYGRYISELTGKKIYMDFSEDEDNRMIQEAENDHCLLKFNINLMGGKILLKSDKNIGRLLNLKYKVTKKLACILSSESNYQKAVSKFAKGKIGKLLHKMGIVLNFEVSVIEEYYKEEIKGNMLVKGYFQTPYFAEKIRDILLKEITLKNISDQMIIAEELITRPNSVAVYIQCKKDALTGEYICNNDYYIRSIKRMIEILGNDLTFYIFSNNFEYVKGFLEALKYNIVFVEWDLKEYEELILMSKCRHFILSNNSLSWWGQFLSQNKNKIVISPSNLFTNDQYKSSILCNDWITMESRALIKSTQEII